MGVLVIKISTYDYGKNKGYTTRLVNNVCNWKRAFSKARATHTTCAVAQ